LRKPRFREKSVAAGLQLSRQPVVQRIVTGVPERHDRHLRRTQDLPSRRFAQAALGDLREFESAIDGRAHGRRSENLE
jgi:hypothetical protein